MLYDTWNMMKSFFKKKSSPTSIAASLNDIHIYMLTCVKTRVILLNVATSKETVRSVWINTATIFLPRTHRNNFEDE